MHRGPRWEAEPRATQTARPSVSHASLLSPPYAPSRLALEFQAVSGARGPVLGRQGVNRRERDHCALETQPETAWVPFRLWPHSVIMEDLMWGGGNQAAAPCCSSITPALYWSGPDISKGKKQQESLFIQRKGAASRANADHAPQQMPAPRGLCANVHSALQVPSSLMHPSP
ncbi:hypothetical protein KIL84_009887 [Mauremys mutica]|uniref:Uncharacterized protein n=1 Tax=Mauremys mutica TaxID=74926 RepID=A0A9D3XLJ7_9SAUR|nr:hypothetical protein KIL84_009887 [Mauremys mutica]